MEFRVVRITDRFDEACAYFGDVLGWPVTRHWDASGFGETGRGKVFGYGIARVELMETTGSPVSGSTMLSIEVDDVDALHDRLIAAGMSVVQPPTDQPWGHRNLAVEEPTGMYVYFFTWLDGVER